MESDEVDHEDLICSVHVRYANEVYWCYCCEREVQASHICACEVDNEE